MPGEQDHLSQLRSSLAAVERAGDDRAVRDAVQVLLRVAIAHHESTGLGVSPEETPAFMESGEPVALPGA